jgi:hypothetical protein
MVGRSVSRFKVVEKSVSAHCCFEATVIDTENDDRSICECFEIEDANRIAAAMNSDDASEYQW